MMSLHWIDLNDQDRAVFLIATAFLDGRLEQRSTVDWAICLKQKDTPKRLALLELIDSPKGREMSEPWLSAWRLVEEWWSNPTANDYESSSAFDAQRRLRFGDRSGSLVTAIVDLVEPRLEIKPMSSSFTHSRELPKQPKKVKDLFWMELTSGELIDPEELQLESLTDHSFLVFLARALDAVVVRGLDIARRIGWDGAGNLLPLGGLNRVYYSPKAEPDCDQHEPDKFSRGIAPSVKLLHAVVSRLAKINSSIAIEFVHRWKVTNSSVHLRLWAALSRDSSVTPAKEVGTLFLSLNDQCFWSPYEFPEIAELRAKRFSELDSHTKAAITARIRKCPPASFWPRKSDFSRVKDRRLYWAVRELLRIEIAGTPLSKTDKDWLDARIHKFPDLGQMARLDEGFRGITIAHEVSPKPDSGYDLLSGKERLRALEGALSSKSTRDDLDSSDRAADWIRQSGNFLQILGDFDRIADGGAAFPKVWDQFGWTHSPLAGKDNDSGTRDLVAESGRVLSLLAKLPEATIRHAIDGISNWLSMWEKQVVALPDGLRAWLKLWPIAVKVTNAKKPVEDENPITLIAGTPDEQERNTLDTLNTPVGKLVGVFLTACPTVRPGDTPFSENNAQRQMRDEIDTSIGPSGLIVKYRLIEGLRYFLNADLDWTRDKLVPLLLEDNDNACFLWGAVARRRRFFDELKVIGASMAERATDLRLGRETRRALVFSLVVECLHAFREQREPAISKDRITQMIRLLDDETRASAAEAVQRFLRDVSSQRDVEQTPPSPEDLFHSSVSPFLHHVWPQERSLATPGVSRALADLPATARDAFAEMVAAIERFLVPFECWSMVEYGLHGEQDGKPKLANVNNPEKADAFLRLLDLTIGTVEGAVIPHGLADALDQIRNTAPKLANRPEFRRLGTAARRR